MSFNPLQITQGADGYLAFFTGASGLAGDNDLYFNRITHDLTLTGGGKLGVGLSAPIDALHVKGSAQGSIIRVEDVAGSTSTWSMFASTARLEASGTLQLRHGSNLDLQSGASTILRVSGSRVGIGGFTPTLAPLEVLETASSPTATTDVLALKADTSGTAGAGLGAAIRFYMEDDGGSEVAAGGITSIWESAAAGAESTSFRFNTRNAGANKEALIIKNDAKVGIGTFNPQNMLDVDGAVVIGDTFAGVETADSSGLLVEGRVKIGATDAVGGAITSQVNATVTSNATEGTIVAVNNNSTGDPMVSFALGGVIDWSMGVYAAGVNSPFRLMPGSNPSPSMAFDYGLHGFYSGSGSNTFWGINEPNAISPLHVTQIIGIGDISNVQRPLAIGVRADGLTPQVGMGAKMVTTLDNSANEYTIASNFSTAWEDPTDGSETARIEIDVINNGIAPTLDNILIINKDGLAILNNGVAPRSALHVVGDGYFDGYAVAGHFRLPEIDDAPTTVDKHGLLYVKTSDNNLHYVDSSGTDFDLTGGSPVSGTGSAGQIAFWDGATSIDGENNLYWDSASDRLGIGTATPQANLHVHGDGYFDGYVNPFTDNMWGLGSPDKRWSDLFVGPSSLHIVGTAAEVGVDRSWNIGLDSSGDFRLRQGLDDALTASATGIVNIPNQLAVNESSPTSEATNRLHITGSTNASGAAAQSGDVILIDGGGGTAVINFRANTGSAGTYGLWFSDDVHGRASVTYAHGTDKLTIRSGGQPVATFTSTGVALNTSFGTPLNVIDAAGAVVIGSTFALNETAPTDGLLVEGSSRFGANTFLTDSVITASGNTGGSRRISINNDGAGDAFFSAGVGGDVKWSFGVDNSTTNDDLRLVYGSAPSTATQGIFGRTTNEGAFFGINKETATTVLDIVSSTIKTDVSEGVLTLTHQTSGTATDNFGSGILFRNERPDTVLGFTARIDGLWRNAAGNIGSLLFTTGTTNSPFIDRIARMDATGISVLKGLTIAQSALDIGGDGYFDGYVNADHFRMPELGVAPTAVDDHGLLYVSSADNNLHYIDSSGTDFDLTPTGSITAAQAFDGYISFFTGSNGIAGDNDLFWDREGNKLLVKEAVVGGLQDKTTIYSGVFGQNPAWLEIGHPDASTSGTTNFGYLVLTTDQPAASSGVVGALAFVNRNIGSGEQRLANINVLTDGATDQGYLAIQTKPSGGSVLEAMRIDSSQRVGIGTTAPKNRLDVDGSMVVGSTYAGVETADTDGLLVEGDVAIGTTSSGAFNLLVSSVGETPFATARYASNSSPHSWSFRRARGSEASPSDVVDGDPIGIIGFQPYVNGGFAERTNITAIVNGTVGSPDATDVPIDLIFNMNISGGGSITERLRLTSEGVLTFSGAENTEGRITFANQTPSSTRPMIVGRTTNDSPDGIMIDLRSANQETIIGLKHGDSAGVGEILYNNGMNFTNASNENVLYMAVDGYVGLKTATPQNNLDVSGGVAIGSTYAGIQAAPTDGLIVTGKVGIGGVPAAGQAETLQVTGHISAVDGYLESRRNSSGFFGSLVLDGDNGASDGGTSILMRYFHDTKWVTYQRNAGVQPHSYNINLGDSANDEPTFRITPGEKFGFNRVSNPQSTVDIKGNLTVGSTYAGVNAAEADGAIIEGKVGIGRSDTSIDSAHFQVEDTTGLPASFNSSGGTRTQVSINNTSTGDPRLAFSTNNASKAHIDYDQSESLIRFKVGTNAGDPFSNKKQLVIRADNDYVGIQTLTPEANLDVRGDGYFDGYLNPYQDNMWGLGSLEKRWSGLVVGPQSLHIVGTAAEVGSDRHWSMSLSPTGDLDLMESDNKTLSVSATGLVAIGGQDTGSAPDTIDSNTVLYVHKPSAPVDAIISGSGTNPVQLILRAVDGNTSTYLKFQRGAAGERWSLGMNSGIVDLRLRNHNTGVDMVTFGASTDDVTWQADIFDIQTTAGAEFFRVDTTTSRVGIGTDSPGADLDVQNSSGAVSGQFVSSSGDATVQVDSGNGERARFILKNNGNDAWQLIKDAGNDFLLINKNVGNTSNTMFADANTNYVGINFDNPQANLHVHGDGYFDGYVNPGTANLGLGSIEKVWDQVFSNHLNLKEVEAPVEEAGFGRLYVSSVDNDLHFVDSAGADVNILQASGVTGSGGSGQITYWTGGSTLGGDTDFVWDTATNKMGVGTASPSATLHVAGDGYFDGYLMPFNDNSVGLGTPDKRWRDLYVGPDSLHIVGKPGETLIDRTWVIGMDTNGGAADGSLRIRQGDNISMVAGSNGAVTIGGSATPPGQVSGSDINLRVAGPNEQSRLFMSGSQNYIYFSGGSAFIRWFSGLPFTMEGNADDILLNTDSSQNSLFIAKTTNNVGLGTATPQNRLDVSGGMAIGSTYAGTNAAAADSLIVEGTVAIGATTTPSANIPFNIEGGGSTAARIYAGTESGLILDSALSSAVKIQLKKRGDRWIIGLDTTNDHFQVFNDIAGPVALHVDYDAQQFVGVNTDSPQANLHVHGDGYFDGYVNPFTDNMWGLGSVDKRWSDLVLGPDSLHIVGTAAEVGADRHWNIRLGETGNLVFSHEDDNAMIMKPTGDIEIDGLISNKVGDIILRPASDEVEITGTGNSILNFTTGSGFIRRAGVNVIQISPSVTIHQPLTVDQQTLTIENDSAVSLDMSQSGFVNPVIHLPQAGRIKALNRGGLIFALATTDGRISVVNSAETDWLDIYYDGVIDNLTGTIQLGLDAAASSHSLGHGDVHIEQHLEVDGYIYPDRGIAFSIDSTATDLYLDGSITITGVTDTSVPRTIYLPDAADFDGNILMIKDESGGAGTNNITVSAADAAQNVDGGSVTINTNYGSVRVYSNGSNWFSI